MIEKLQEIAGNRAVSQWWGLVGKQMLYRQQIDQDQDLAMLG